MDMFNELKATLAATTFVEWVGWFSTLIFSLSYVFKTKRSLMLTQLCGACSWMTYGVLLHAHPVVLANAVVACGSLYQLWRGRGEAGDVGAG